jgi:hypothetical protein
MNMNQYKCVNTTGIPPLWNILLNVMNYQLHLRHTLENSVHCSS